jgi:conjugative relaxase-like TrwC/TraI family protein
VAVCFPMLRVTTLYASTAAATAGYYTRYLTQAEGEVPGVWAGRQASRFSLVGTVEAGHLERLLTGCDPHTGETLGHPLFDRTLTDGRVVRAVSGFDATVSAPKSLSAWWALTGDQRLLDAHDVAVNAVIDTLRRYGATTRIRSNGGRLHPDTEGLMIAAFRQSTSRLDDPQIHTHVVISAKVQVDDGRWFALDARMLKKHQRTLGGIYQSVLRAELTERFGVRFGEIVNGQAEIAGVPQELLDVFSKRAAQVGAALANKLTEFHDREQREPTKFEHAALQREAAADTRRSKTGATVPDLRTRWVTEANDIGTTPHSLVEGIRDAARTQEPEQRRSTRDIQHVLAERASTWHRLDVLRTLTDELRPRPGMTGERWLAFLERSTDAVIADGIDLDPVTAGTRRSSDGRSIWVEPTAAHYTSDAVLAQEEHIATWAFERQAANPQPSNPTRTAGLDERQAEAAAAVAGHDPLVIVVGPAGTGKTTMLAAAVDDLHEHGRPMYAVAPTAKAARVLGRETGAEADTVAKLIHEWTRPDRPPADQWNLIPGTTLLVDEAGMLNTADLHTFTRLADLNDWRIALLGDPYQLHAVGRGGMFDEICSTARVHELTEVHRFTHPWEATASLALRRGDPRVIDTYFAHDRVVAGTLQQHVAEVANRWMTATAAGQSVAITTATNEHVALLNRTIQRQRIDAGYLADGAAATGADAQAILVGDHIATGANDRRLRTSRGDHVRNRETWTVTAVSDTGDITAQRHRQGDIVILPAAYVARHVQLGYATTEPGNQGDTHDLALTLVTPATTGRGLYVSMTRGRHDNTALVVTDEPTRDAAADVLARVLASDRADLPAITQRRELAAQVPPIVRTPQPTPRCHVPDWWHELRADAVNSRARAQAALDEIDTDKADRADRRAVVAAESQQAWAEFLPYKETYNAAAGRLDDAEAAHKRAEAAFEASGLRGRRVARQALSEASIELHAAQQAFAPIDRIVQPLRQALHRTSHLFEEMRQNHTMLDTIADRQRLPEKITTIQERIEALDGWRHWARGGSINTETATWITDVLAATNEPRHEALANAIPAIAPELTASPPGAEFDVGIDL